MIEQLLTTGGGWQDQVNGLLPGVKMGKSEQSEVLKVTYDLMHCKDAFLKELESRLLLVFTGKVRLAKNLLQVFLSIIKVFQSESYHFLLQDVIRQWYTGSDEIVKALKLNYSLAEQMWDAIAKGTITFVIDCKQYLTKIFCRGH